MSDNKLQSAGKKMEKMGCLLTMIITIPLVLTVWLGTLGMIIGGVIAVLALAGALGGSK